MQNIRIPERDWEWLGHAGHYIMGHKCLFHLATKVGKYLISTVGDCHLEISPNKIGEKIPVGSGAKEFFSTYVFKAGKKLACGCYGLKSVPEIEGKRCETSVEARILHMKYCNKYAEEANL